jgi:hypothetical protein
MSFLKNIASKVVSEYADSAVQFVAGRTFDVGAHQYKVTKTIGEGGFAFVFAAKDERGAPVAIKLLHCASADRFAAAKREVALMRALPRHANLLQLLDAAASAAGAKSEVVLVLEFCGGGSCASHIARRIEARTPFRAHELWAVFGAVVDAVRVLHGQAEPVAHRDLKPENVLLSDVDRHWKLCDFGSATTRTYDCSVAAERDAAEHDIERNTTLAYRAPEMVDLYRRQLVDEQVDVWALGCLLFKLAYFAGPFDNGEALGILNGAYYVPFAAQTLYEPVVKDTIDWLLTNDPALRPTAEEVAERIARIRQTDYVPHAGAKALTERRRSKPARAPAAAAAADERPAPAPQPKRPAAQDASALFGMLGGGDTIAAQPSEPARPAARAAAPAAAAAAPAKASGVDLFAAFDAPPAAPKAAAAPSAFDAFGLAPFPSSAPPAAAAPLNANTAFGGADFSGFQSAKPAAAPAADFGFGGFQSAPPTAPSQAAAFGGFGGFQTAAPTMAKPAAAAVPAAAPQAAKSSVFDLMANPTAIDLGLGSRPSASAAPAGGDARRTAVPMAALAKAAPQQQAQAQAQAQGMKFDEFAQLLKK